MSWRYVMGVAEASRMVHFLKKVVNSWAWCGEFFDLWAVKRFKTLGGKEYPFRQFPNVLWREASARVSLIASQKFNEIKDMRPEIEFEFLKAQVLEPFAVAWVRAFRLAPAASDTWNQLRPLVSYWCMVFHVLLWENESLMRTTRRLSSDHLPPPFIGSHCVLSFRRCWHVRFRWIGRWEESVSHWSVTPPGTT